MNFQDVFQLERLREELKRISKTDNWFGGWRTSIEAIFKAYDRGDKDTLKELCKEAGSLLHNEEACKLKNLPETVNDNLLNVKQQIQELEDKFRTAYNLDKDEHVEILYQDPDTIFPHPENFDIPNPSLSLAKKDFKIIDDKLRGLQEQLTAIKDKLNKDINRCKEEVQKAIENDDEDMTGELSRLDYAYKQLEYNRDIPILEQQICELTPEHKSQDIYVRQLLQGLRNRYRERRERFIKLIESRCITCDKCKERRKNWGLPECRYCRGYHASYVIRYDTCKTCGSFGVTHQPEEIVNISGIVRVEYEDLEICDDCIQGDVYC